MNPQTKLPLAVHPLNVDKFQHWLDSRGGLAVWESKLIGEQFRSWTTPARQVDGTPTPPPDWRCGNEPALVITDPRDVVVEVPKEIARYEGETYSDYTGKPYAKFTRWKDKLEAEHPEGWCVERGDRATFYVADKLIPLTEWSASNLSNNNTQ